MAEAIYTLANAHTTCYHCGEDCDESGMVFDHKAFCCAGCKTVYELLGENNLSCYYDLNDKPGTSQKLNHDSAKYNWLDDTESVKKLIQYSDEKVTIVTFFIPSIHCSSCIYLLENIYKIQPAISKAQVNFLRKEVKLTFYQNEISLRKVVELIARLGYEPQLNMVDLENAKQTVSTKQYYLKIGIAFFCFGNIMLLSFPEYLGLNALSEHPMHRFFGYANFLLALPVLFYSAREFFVSAYTALRQRSLNMDIPIVLGMVVMFLRSSYDIFMQQGAGYMDTLASLTLLMLVGRLFQNKTYATLSFERDYKSYFPVSVSIRKDGIEQTIPLSKLQVGNKIIVRNQELIPADAILLKGQAMIDYSFVTGESNAIPREIGETIFAGGRQVGSAIEMEIIKDVSHSYLTQLWNDDAFKSKEHESTAALANKVSRYFTPIVILIAVAAGAYWFRTDMHKALNAFTAVLIITCPCALALSTPFTLGNVIRILGNHGIYLKNTFVIEKVAKIRTIIFDKTGTLTNKRDLNVSYQGEPLSDTELIHIASLTYHSSHPLSKKVFSYLNGKKIIPTKDFLEVEGKGIEGWINDCHIKVGSAGFAQRETTDTHETTASTVHINIDGHYRGYYEIRSEYREGLEQLIKGLKKDFDICVLSGDNDSEKKYLQEHIAADHLLFDQQPIDKLNFIKKVQSQNHNRVMMIGDGLNDAGALMQSDVGLVISDDTNNFSPACDGIVDAKQFENIHSLMRYSRISMQIIIASYVISLLYNTIGISLAVQGTMSPIVAAILMPISSVTIISFSTLASYLTGRWLIFK
jgi:Cu+-exporting ATPase